MRELTVEPPGFSYTEDFLDRAAGLAKGSIVEALVNRYPPGASVGWHNDASVYKTIIGISLEAPCTIQFKVKATEAHLPRGGASSQLVISAGRMEEMARSLRRRMP